MAQTETGQQKQRGRMPAQPPGSPMGLHDVKRKRDPEHPELWRPCECGGCSFTEPKTVVVKTSARRRAVA